MKEWQTIVPESDRAVFEKAGFGQRQRFGQRPALVIVDVTVAFVGPRPQNVLDSVETHKASCGESAWVALPKIAELLAACRGKQIPVVYTVPVLDIPTTKIPEGKLPRSIFGPPGEEAKGLEIVEPVAPLPNEPVFSKPKASGFFRTWLDTYLRSQNVDCLLVCGVSTSGCVRATAVDGFNHDFTVFVVEDCCFDRSSFFHRASLYDMNAKYANVITLGEALAYLSPSGRHRRHG
ncbi:MAG: isochorismatase family protein [Chloroflexi bacterium]|nr:isochorismatase family protein [Chloroflexota bacterium]